MFLKEERIKEICREAGWSEKKAAKELSKASKLGINSYYYMKNEGWTLSASELEALSAELKEKAEKKQKQEALKKERVLKICEETGWSEEKAREELHSASKLGINSNYYMMYRGWTLSVSELEALSVELKEKAEKKQKQEALRKERVQTICQETGWDEEKAAREMEKARAMGVPNRQYVEKNLFQLSEDELLDYSQLTLDYKERQRQDREYYIAVACKKSGWSREEVVEGMSRAKTLGISGLKYVQNACWESSDEDIEALAEALDRDKSRIRNNKNKYLTGICEATGWTKGKAELEVLRAKANCEASYEDYFAYKMHEMSEEEQRKYVTLGMFNKVRMLFNDHFTAVKNFDDKAMFNTHFKDLIKHKWFVNENISYEEFLNNIEGLNRVIIKPLAAAQGKGVEAADCNISEKKNKELYEYIISKPKSIVEEYIVQHEEIMEFCRTSVNTLRIATLNYNGECRILYSVFKMGNGKVANNMSAGGVAAAVDVKTGIIYTNAADLEGNVFTTSPATGKKIKGYQIPHWDKIIETCKKAYDRVEGVDLIGWDIAITPDGVDLIEGNSGVSYILVQIPNIEDKIGLVDVLVTPYLEQLGEKGDKYVIQVSEAAGISVEQALEEMKKAKEKLGITYQEYYKHELYSMNSSQQSRKARDLKKRRKTREDNLAYISTYTGLTEKEIQREIKRTNSTSPFKVNIANAAKYDILSQSKEKQPGLLSNLAELEKLKERIKVGFKEVDAGDAVYDDITDELNEYQLLTAAVLTDKYMAKSREILIKCYPELINDEEKCHRAIIDMEIAKMLLGFSETEYVSYDFQGKTIAEKRKFLNEEERLKILSSINDSEQRNLLGDKYQTYQLLNPYYKRKMIFINDENDFDSFREFCGQLSEFVVKPINSTFGYGVKLIQVDQTPLRKVFDELLGDYVCFIAEERIIVHDSIKALNPDSVNTIRLNTYYNGETTVIHSPFLRVGQKGAFVDNAKEGGIILSVDPDTGVIDSDGCDESGINYKEHPYTKVQFKGYQLPDWQQALELGKELSTKVPGVSYIGWDIAYTEEGKWIVVEGNSLPQFYVGRQYAKKEGVREEFMELVGYEPL